VRFVHPLGCWVSRIRKKPIREDAKRRHGQTGSEGPARLIGGYFEPGVAGTIRGKKYSWVGKERFCRNTEAKGEGRGKCQNWVVRGGVNLSREYRPQVDRGQRDGSSLSNNRGRERIIQGGHEI